MANVRIDQHGVPKGPVYEMTAPQVHRSGVTEIDSSDPEGTSGAIDGTGYQCCRLDVTINGSGFTSLDVQGHILESPPVPVVWRCLLAVHGHREVCPDGA